MSALKNEECCLQVVIKNVYITTGLLLNRRSCSCFCLINVLTFNLKVNKDMLYVTTFKTL